DCFRERDCIARDRRRFGQPAAQPQDSPPGSSPDAPGRIGYTPRRCANQALEPAMKYLVRLLIAQALIAPVTMIFGADPYAEQLFQKNCASCHQATAGAEARVPQIAALKTMTPAAILRTLESGIMKAQAAPLSGDERLKVATFLGTAITVERRREEIANPCPAGGPWKNTPSWNSWGGGLANTRYLPANEAGLQADSVPRLTLKWAFAF